MFNQYPYLNLNDLNLDYILKAIKEMRYEVTNFVSINAIKYADPIQWNITSQYEKNTIVIDPVTGTAYISVAAVPAGVALTRPEYWTVVFDLGSFVTRAAKNFTTRYEQDTTTTATFPTAAGEWLVWGDTLYIANVNITAGDSYVVDGNIRHITVEEVKNTIMQLIADNYNAIVAMIGDLDDLTTTAKNNIVAAINELVSGLSDEAQTRADADSALQDAINDEARARQDAIDDILDGCTIDGNLEVNGNLQVNGNIYGQSGAFSGILHPNVIAPYQNNPDIEMRGDTHVTGDLTVDGNIVGMLPDIGKEKFNGKTVIMLADSLGTQGWANQFGEYIANCGGTFHNYSVAGVNSAEALQHLQELTPETIDYAIIWLGRNDWADKQYPGNIAALATGTYGYYMNAICQELINHWGNPQTFILGCNFTHSSSYPSVISDREYSRMAYAIARRYGYQFIDLYAMQLDAPFQNLTVWSDSAGIHFNADFQRNILLPFIKNSILYGSGGLLTFNSEYDILNYPDFLTNLNSVTLQNYKYIIHDDGSADLSLTFTTTAQINAGRTVIAKLNNFPVFAIANTLGSFSINVSPYSIYYALLLNSATGDIRITPSDTIPSGTTLYVQFRLMETNLNPYFKAQNLV